MFIGFFDKDTTATGIIQTRNSGGTPANADAFPTFIIYGPDDSIIDSGNVDFLHGGAVEDASSTSPITITATSHGLQEGQLVTVSGVTGNTAANGTFTAVGVTTDTFDLQGTTGNGAYGGGGQWNVSGLYKWESFVGSNYGVGLVYQIVGAAIIGGILAGGSPDSFQVP